MISSGCGAGCTYTYRIYFLSEAMPLQLEDISLHFVMCFCYIEGLFICITQPLRGYAVILPLLRSFAG
jgi:hypothetical protein